MPELPDITVYIECLEARIVGQPIESIRLVSPFVLRTVEPAYRSLEGRAVRGLRRMGKRIVWEFDDDIFLVIHLMRLGRLRWDTEGKKVGRKILLATFEFPTGTLHMVETGTKKRASIHIVSGTDALVPFDRGGLEVLEADLPAFAAVLTRRNHTLKRAMTDQRLLSGIGNAYSDEILHAAGLSPIKLTSRLTEDEIERLFEATRKTLTTWTDRLRTEVGEGFPKKVTAFRPEMAVHGRFKEPCPVCKAPVQRIVYASRETNYCAKCQTGGKLLADRALSRLLGKDWPRTLEELEG